MRIPNTLSVSVAVSFYVAAMLLRLPLYTVVSHTVFGLAVLAALYLAYRRQIGGGAVKLIAALSLWLGPSFVFGVFLLYTVLLMGLFTVAAMIWRRQRGETGHWEIPVLPFAAIGFALSFPESHMFALMLPAIDGNALPFRYDDIPAFLPLVVGAVCLLSGLLALRRRIAVPKLAAIPRAAKPFGVWGNTARAKAQTSPHDHKIDPDRIKAMLSRSYRTSEAPATTRATEPPPAGPTSFAEIATLHARPAVIAYRPYPPHRVRHGRSKVGGCPDLPEGVAWPRTVSDSPGSAAGVPLHFVGQIDLAELPWRPEECPDHGTMLFFARVDEEMYWQSEPGGEPRNDAQVIYDPASNGRMTAPPADLLPIEGGRNLYDQAFSQPDSPVLHTYPEWPLDFAEFTSVPGLTAFNYQLEPGYFEARQQFNLRQIFEILPKVHAKAARGREIPIFEKPTDPLAAVRDPVAGVKSFAETEGFPYSPMFISFLNAYVGGKEARRLMPASDAAVDGFLQGLQQWADWAGGQTAGRIDGAKARDFIAFLNQHMAGDFAGKKLLVEGIQRSLKEMVNWSGGNPELAVALPDSLYHAADRHPLWVMSGDEGSEFPEKPSSSFKHPPYHQLFGHQSTAQWDAPANSKTILLLQLFSDYGADMMFCDVGEIDFTIEPEDLKDGRWERVIGETCGG